MKSFFHIALFLLTTITFAQASHIDPTPKDFSYYKLCDQKVMIPAGTLVMLEVNEIRSTELAVGRKVEMRVAFDVTIKEEVVIKTGAFAVGRIKSIDTGGYSSKASITLELEYVLAVDGTTVPLFGNEQTFLASNPGEPGQSESNGLITAQTRNNIKIAVD